MTEVITELATELATPYLDRQLEAIEMRLVHEQIMELVPSVRAQNEQNKVLVSLLFELARVFQKNEISIFADEETGLTTNGYDPAQAAAEVDNALRAVRELAVRYQ